MSTVTQRIQEYFEANGVASRVIEHERAASAEEYHRVLGTRYSQQAKAVFLRHKRPGAKGFAVLALPAQKRADLAKAAELLSAREVRLGTEEQMRETTGCSFGELPPIGGLFGLPLVMDVDLLAEDEIFFNAGDLCVSLAVAPADLRALEEPVLYSSES